MVRGTSIEAYNHIKEKGLLTGMRMAVYDAIYKSGECTSGEAFANYLSDNDKSGFITQSRARFTELREMGVVYEKYERPCKITGRTAIVWALTGDLPIPLAKKITKKQKFITILDELALKNDWEMYRKVKDACGVKHLFDHLIPPNKVDENGQQLMFN
jgi:hypothetical protein